MRVSGRMNDVTHDVRQLNFRDVHLGLRTDNVGVGTNKKTCSTFFLGLLHGVAPGVLVAG